MSQIPFEANRLPDRIVTRAVLYIGMLLAIAACVSSCQLTKIAPTAFAKTPEPSGHGAIAFVITGRGQDSSIYQVDEDGRNLILLSSEFGKSSNPAWSPDGRELAFISWTDDAPDLYVMTDSGKYVDRLTHRVGVARTPSWSPDGRRIAFTGIVEELGREIEIVNLENKVIVNVTNHPASDQDPAWSPVADRIVFASDRSGTYEIYVMNIDGKGVNQLTNDPFGCHSPAWSPDGKRIAYVCNTNRGAVIETMNADGSRRSRLINPDDYLDGSHPSWSPDGTRIVFQSIRSGLEQIYVMKADGTGTVQLTDLAPLGIIAMQPSWGRPSR